MERIFDLPAHPLMIHYPAVAIPVLSIVAIVLVAMPRFRPSWRLFTIGLSVTAVIATFFAAASGQALADAISFGETYDESISTHRTLGRTLRYFVLGLGVTASAMTVLGDRDRQLAPAANAALNALVVIFAILSLVWAIRTGHEGASFHWEGILPAE